MEDHEKGRDTFASEDAYRFHCLRHSTAHLLAQAVMRLHPEARLAIGPPIEDGFYYDIELPTPLREEDLLAIAAEMKRIVKENQRFEHETWSKDQAREYFGGRGQVYKLELIDGIAGDTVSVYKNPGKEGEPFLDLCAGPHVLRTGQCKHFQLTKVSGAYWRANPQNSQLQRVYGTVWPTREELDAYLFRVEEARKRDHRKLGQKLELIMFHEWAPGAAFFLPKGEILYHTLAERMRHLLASEGYQVVRTPLLFDQKLWQTSGHWEHYQANMFAFAEASPGVGTPAGPRSDEAAAPARIFGLKPMNCPSHMLIYRSAARSYRDLPLRLHDQGVLHRNELSGALSGLTRVRQFCQDDAHLFCAAEQLEAEVGKLLDLVGRVYSAFDMAYTPKLSTRPEDRMGEEALWDAAEDALRKALETRGIDYQLNAGDGVFYGPKIDFDVTDALGRAHQCATVQLDFQLPRRFELTYVGPDGAPHVPVVIHRAIFGSFERFIGILIEHYAGKFPLWLAPEQVRIMTVSEKSLAHGQRVTDTLRAADCRVSFDDSAEKIGYKIRACHAMQVPYMAIIGEAEAQDGTVSVRSRDDGDVGSMSLDTFVARVRKEATPRL
jgi:threonyl-tRNA synthetase